MALLDNEKYRPAFIKKLLADPPLMPGQNHQDFTSVFEQMELTQAGKAQSEREYMMVFHATKLTNEVCYYARMKSKIMRMYQRQAVTSLLFESQDHAGNSRLSDALKGMAHADTHKFYTDVSFKNKSLKKIEAVGFGPDAVEVRAFMLSLGVIAQLDEMIAKAEKRLMKFLEELEISYRERAKRLKQVAKEAIDSAAMKE